MKNVLFMLALLPLCVCPAAAGNRADVNADRAVNAADSVCLANILAGNLDASEFNLENVVVVAPQGGDFTNPADAADWVTAQSPSATHRFVILVAPGEYQLTRAVWLPSYTTLRGHGRQNTVIIRAGGAPNPPYGAIVVLNSTTGSAIEDLRLRKDSGGSTNSAAVYVFSSTVRIENCDVSLSSTVTYGIAIYSLGTSYIDINGSYIFAEGNDAPADLANSVAGVYLEALSAYHGAEVRLLYSEILTSNMNGTAEVHKYAYGVVLGVDESNESLHARYSFIWPRARLTSDAYYLYRDEDGTAWLAYCYLLTQTNFDDGITRIMCNIP